MSSVTIDTSITINVEQADGITAVLTLTIEEARALKDELIRAVGAQNPIQPGLIRECGPYAPVIQPKGGFINTDATSPLKKLCHCGEPGWGQNGCCGTSGCSNVPT